MAEEKDPCSWVEIIIEGDELRAAAPIGIARTCDIADEAEFQEWLAAQNTMRDARDKMIERVMRPAVAILLRNIEHLGAPGHYKIELSVVAA